MLYGTQQQIVDKTINVIDNGRQHWQKKQVLSQNERIHATKSSFDDACISSRSSEIYLQARRRSIFSSKCLDQDEGITIPKGRKPKISQPGLFRNYSDSQTKNMYERALKQPEKILTRNEDISDLLSRYNAKDQHQLSRLSLMTGRKAYSDSALVVVEKLPSCLRSPKILRKAKTCPVTRREHVSFSPTVTVVKFDTFKECWTAPGWSGYFH